MSKNGIAASRILGLCGVVPSDKESIKNWLRDNERSREWLADKCDVNKRTVDNWLSSPRAVPQKALRTISRLMQADALAHAPFPVQNLVLQLDPATFERYNRAAMACGRTVTEWAVDSLNQAARRYPIDAPGHFTAKVAEEEGPAGR